MCALVIFSEHSDINWQKKNIQSHYSLFFHSCHSIPFHLRVLRAVVCSYVCVCVKLSQCLYLHSIWQFIVQCLIIDSANFFSSAHFVWLFIRLQIKNSNDIDIYYIIIIMMTMLMMNDDMAYTAQSHIMSSWWWWLWWLLLLYIVH